MGWTLHNDKVEVAHLAEERVHQTHHQLGQAGLLPRQKKVSKNQHVI